MLKRLKTSSCGCLQKKHGKQKVVDSVRLIEYNADNLSKFKAMKEQKL